MTATTIHPADAKSMQDIQDIFLMEEKIIEATERAYLLGYMRGRLDGAESSHRTMADICERMQKKETT